MIITHTNSWITLIYFIVINCLLIHNSMSINSKYCIQGQTHLSHRITEPHILNELLACWFLDNLIRDSPHPQDCHVINWKLIKHRGLRPAHHNVAPQCVTCSLLYIQRSRYVTLPWKQTFRISTNRGPANMTRMTFLCIIALRNKTVTHTFSSMVLTMLNVISVKKDCWDTEILPTW